MRGTRRLVLSIALVGVVVAGSIAGFLTGTRPQLGLDLVGGISVVLAGPAGTPKDVMERTLETIRNRIDALGVAEPEISLIGDNQIQVQVPGLARGTETRKDGKFCGVASSGEKLGCNFPTRDTAVAAVQAFGQQRLLDLIGRTALLEQRQVMGPVPQGTKVTSCPPGLNDPKCRSKKYVECPLGLTSGTCSDKALATRNVVYLGKDNQGNDPTSLDSSTKYQLGPVLITGAAVSKATAVYQTASQTGSLNQVGWQVDFQLTSEGAKLFGDITTRLQGQELAIILDRLVESAPVIQSPITTGSGQITGTFSEQEAKDLALVLNAGALPVELTKQNVETVSPTLGKTSLHQGLIAGIFGLILLALYLAFYYRLLGVVTWLGMSIWATLALALVSVMGKTVGYSLSLAGIAGLVVSMGITADSYIVFYERLKDEVRQGKTLRTAVMPAFRRAWRTIVAADTVTILAAAILYLLAIGSVRGFALTLGLCTGLDLFVVYFFKRPTVFLLARNPTLANMRGIGLRSGVAAEPVPVAGGSE